ncbi:MAG: 3-deoxy-D-manno-octulosonic acid transferase [Gemmatimonadaceae bacterium]
MHPLARAAYVAAGHAANLAAAIVPESNNKILRSLAARHRLLDRWETWGRAHRDPQRPLVWVHAPSVGEGLQARPLLELLRERRPDVQLAYSFFSPSAEEFARRLPVDIAGFLPFDTPQHARRIVHALRPSALVFSKLDVWPLLCEAATKAGVPLGMISGTVSPGSARRGGLAGSLLSDAYASFAAVGASSTYDAQRLVELGVSAHVVQVTGDTRYDQVWTRAHQVKRDAPLMSRLAGSRPTLVAGSTWPPDEAVLLPAWLAVRAHVPRARLIIAPHEPTPAHLSPIERWAEAADLAVVRLDDPDVADADVVLVDRVGVLGDLYSLGTSAFVGGGFHAAGLHSVLEPAAFGIPVVFGPQHTNSRDAGLLVEADGAAVVRTVSDAAPVIARWLGRDAAAAGAHAAAVVEAGLGAAEKAYGLVVGLLRP